MVIVIDAVRTVVILHGTGYFSDDLLNFGRARAAPLDWAYLSSPNFGNFQPGLRLLDWVVARIVPLPYWPAVVFAVGAMAASQWLLYRVMRRLVGPRWWLAVVVFWVGWSLIGTATQAWWSAGIVYFPASVLGLALVLSFLRYRAGDGRRFAVGSVVCLAAGTCFFSGEFVFAVAVFLLLVLVLPDDRSPAGAWRALAGCRLVLAGYVAVFVAWLTWRTVETQYRYGVPPPSLWHLAGYLAVAWTQGFVASVVGIAYELPNYTTVTPGLVIVGQELLGAAIVLSVLLRRSAWRAWVTCVVPIVLLMVAHGEARPNLGTFFGDTYSDLFPAVVLLAVGVSLAFAPPIATGPATERPLLAAAASWLRHPRRRVLGRPVLAAGVVAYAALVVAQTGTISEVTFARASGAYFATLSSSQRATGAGTAGKPLFDTVLPEPIGQPEWFPLDTAGAILPLFHPGLHIGVRSGPGFLVGPTGAVTEARYRPSGTIDPTTGHPGAGVVRHGACYATAPGGLVTFASDTTSPTASREFFYSPAGRSFARVVATSRTGPATLDGFAVPAGLDTPILVALGPLPPPGALALQLGPRSAICISSLSVGVPEPVAGDRRRGRP